MTRRVRVFLVDDSPSSRLVLRRLVSGDPLMEVCGECGDGRTALERIPASGADVVLMDVRMPGLDGLATTRALMHVSPRPVLVVSDLAGRDGHIGFEALDAGALDIVAKPSAAQLADAAFRARLCRRIRLLSEVPVVRRWRTTLPAGSPAVAADAERIARAGPGPAHPRPVTGLLCVGASTGGPPALLALLGAVGPQPPWPVLVVQHMAAGFIEGLARWLSDATRARVEVARAGQAPEKGVVHVAPDGGHLEVGRDGRYGVTPGQTPGGHVPSVDVLFESVARHPLGTRSAAVLLTGMGRDGARGLLSIRQVGGFTVAQDEATSVVYGMPNAARELGAACEILPLAAIGPRLLGLAHRGA